MQRPFASHSPGADGKDRTVGHPHNLLRHAPEDHPGDAAATVRTEDDQADSVPLRGAYDGGCRGPLGEA